MILLMCYAHFSYASRSSAEPSPPDRLNHVEDHDFKLEKKSIVDDGFLISKVLCTGENMVELCVETINPDPSCIYKYVITLGNGTSIEILDKNFCRTINKILPIKIERFCGSEVIDVKYIQNIDCSLEKCNALNFQYDFDQSHCIMYLGVNISPIIPNPISVVWNFGDGSPSEVGVVDVGIRHKFPISGGNFTVCVTIGYRLSLSQDEDPDYYLTCCFQVYVPPCDDECRISVKSCAPSEGSCCHILYITPAGPSNKYIWEKDYVKIGETNIPEIQIDITDEDSHVYTVYYMINGTQISCFGYLRFTGCNCCKTADFTIFDSDYNCLQKSFTVSPTCALNDSKVKHKWKFNDGSSFEGLVPPSHIFTNYVNSTGNACITHEIYCAGKLQLMEKKCVPVPVGVYIGKQGTVTKLSDIINPPSDPGISVYDFIRKYSNNPSIPLFIDGTLEIDIDASFETGQWYMTANAQINVLQGIRFVNRSVTFTTAAEKNYLLCCRWNGIFAAPQSLIHLESCYIKYAKVGLTLPDEADINGASLNIFSSNFIYNPTAILSNGHRFNVIKFDDNIFNGCVDCNILCGCSEGVAMELNNIPTIGIRIPNTGPTNFMQRFSHGIFALNTNLFVRNINIENLDRDNFSAGIFFKKTIASSRNLNIDEMQFNQMETGVYGELAGGANHTLTALASNPYQSLKFSEVSKGYELYGLSTKITGNIRFNDINSSSSSTAHGIFTYVTLPNNSMTIRNNKININGGAEGSSGISLISILNETQLGKVEDNNIVTGSSQKGIGIFVANWKNSIIRNNILNIGQFHNGIEVLASDRSIISCNRIQNGLRGMSYINAPDLRIVENTCTSNERSMYFEGNGVATLGTYHGYNRLSLSDKESIYFNNSAITGLQRHIEYNRYLGQIGDEVWHKNFGNARLSAIRAPSNVMLGHVNYPNHKLYDVIMKNDGNINVQISSSCFSIADIQGLSIQNGMNGQDLNELISDPNLTTELTDAEGDDQILNILRIIQQNGSWAEQYPQIQSFYNSQNTGYYQEVLNIESMLQNLESMAINYESNIESNINQENVILTQIDSLNTVLNSSTSTSEIVNIRSQIQILEFSLQNIYTNLSLLWSNYQSLFQSALTPINTAINTLPDDRLDRSNRKATFLIQLKQIQNQELNNLEKQSIRNIASQCTSTGGSAIQTARTLVLGIDKNYIDFNSCIENASIPNSSPRSKNIISIEVIPNPASSYVMIQAGGTELKISDITIYGVDSKEIKLKMKKESDHLIKIDTRSLINGIYFVNISNNNINKVIKLRIIK